MDRSSMARWMLIAGSALAIGIVGCSSTGKDTDADQAGATGSEFREDSSAGSASSQASRILQPVYFDFDSFAIRSDAKPTLMANGKAVQDNTGWGVVTCEGHTDERGSEEYNLALGERRANSVKRYLVDLGVPSARLATVSFGEAKPRAMGHDESAWRYNRRVDFTVVN
ncbi:MAG TPA: OmpA family protein [Myxococcota bacterium]